MKTHLLLSGLLLFSGCSSQFVQDVFGIKPITKSTVSADNNTSPPPGLNLPGAVIGLFDGAVGKTTASSGTCTGTGAESAYCTGGTFANGSADGMLNSPYGIAIDSTAGFFYVAETGSHRISKFNSSTGAFIGAIGKTTATSGTCPGGGIAAPGWCTGGTFASGSGDGMFNSPQGVTVDSTNGFLYVADTSNYRVQKFVLASGAFVGAVGYTSATSGTCPGGGVSAASWCTGGTFLSTGATVDGAYYPMHLALDVAGDRLYVVNYPSYVSKLVLSTGSFIGSIGGSTSTTGTCPGGGLPAPGWCTGGHFGINFFDGGFSFGLQDNLVLDVAHDYFYVSGGNTNRVSRFVLSTGAPAGSIGMLSGSSGTCPAAGAAPGWCTHGTFQADATDGGYDRPAGMVADLTHDILYISEPRYHYITKVTLSTGAFIGKLGLTTASTGTCPASGVASAWCSGGTFGSFATDGGYNYPIGLSLDSNTGDLLVIDANVGRVNRIK